MATVTDKPTMLAWSSETKAKAPIENIDGISDDSTSHMTIQCSPEGKLCAHDTTAMLEIGLSINSPEMAKVPTDPSDSMSKASTSE